MLIDISLELILTHILYMEEMSVWACGEGGGVCGVRCVVLEWWCIQNRALCAQELRACKEFFLLSRARFCSFGVIFDCEFKNKFSLKKRPQPPSCQLGAENFHFSEGEILKMYIVISTKITFQKKHFSKSKLIIVKVLKDTFYWQFYARLVHAVRKVLQSSIDGFLSLENPCYMYVSQN